MNYNTNSWSEKKRNTEMMMMAKKKQTGLDDSLVVM
jgi:hypothetical protein